jgi:hypothetical protein
MTQAQNISIEEQIAELTAVGWTRYSAGVWQNPSGAFFRGPHGAWKAMKAKSVLPPAEDRGSSGSRLQDVDIERICK